VREFSIAHPDSALLMYLQGSSTEASERARVALSGQILAPTFFNELRTERQLGYAVFAQPYPLARAPGLLLAVQSPGAGPVKLAAEFEAFLARQSSAVGSLSQQDFERQRATLVERLRESPKSLAEKSARLWSDIGLGALGFDDRERVALEVERIQRDDWIGFFRKQMAGNARRALLLYSRGDARHAEPGKLPGRVLGDAGQWQANAKYYRFVWPVTVQESARELH
jgi:insulysin